MYQNNIEYLQNWDKKSKDYLLNFYTQEANKVNFICELIEYSNSNPNVLNATTWLIKHFVDNKNQIDSIQKDKIIKLLDITSEWESHLHIYQIIPKLEINISNAKYLELKLYKDLFSNNKFLKAAAYKAYFEVVKLFPDLKKEFINICENSLKNECASVKVKIRRILKSIA